MANGFGSIVFTDNGRNLLAKAQTGVQLKFTRIAVGDGMLNGQDATKFKHLLNEVMSLNISEIIFSGSGQAVIESVLSNESLSKGFYWREIGVFATDPQLGEILYGYANANDGEIYVPDKATNIYTTPLNLNLYISNASNVAAAIDSSLVYATKQDIADIKSGTTIVGAAAKVANALTFSAESTVTFDGSAPQTVKIPSKPEDVGAASASQGKEADSAIQSATINGVSVPKSGTKLQFPPYPTSLPANGGNAATLGGRTFNWSGQPGQPNWLWGGNDKDPSNMYVYNPSNFNVNYANSAGDTTSINSSLTVTASEPSGTLAPGKLWGVY